jgi:chromatin remodeling complex protein RSC6
MAKKKSGGIHKKLVPSRELAAVIGKAKVSRGDATKKLWTYIKKHNLQNPENRRNILADDKLYEIFGADEITMFQVGGILNNHLFEE